ncbi:glutathione S-transferase family protein [Methylobacterium sp. WL19]|uniref:glutathione S-transferase family protein n=1 Tax=Methylobacterium sp. WL19 TaxID=2603896 RepID=UPI0011CBCD34|nr:glutathione S-transferase family protein [Methylobacterium sp. WL19]TXN33160.1 glutathione S-transferase family protein [Methylobacterium sp. WL19]
MSEDLILYTHPMSRGRIVRWMLEAVGRPYRAEILDFTALKQPAYLGINPMGKVPALRHGESVVTECAAILAYLADAFPDAGLAPPSGSAERGAYYRWLFFAAGPVEAAVLNTALGIDVPPERKGMAGYGSMAEVLDTLEGAVSGTEYLAGGRFSAADLYLGSHLGWGMQFGTIPRRPAFEAYVGRLYARPAALRASEIDDGLVAASNPAGHVRA